MGKGDSGRVAIASLGNVQHGPLSATAMNQETDMIAKCTVCAGKPHTQDDLHGQGRRVLNVHKTKDGVTVIRCTVCGAETRRGKEQENAK